MMDLNPTCIKQSIHNFKMLKGIRALGWTNLCINSKKLLQTDVSNPLDAQKLQLFTVPWAALPAPFWLALLRFFGLFAYIF